MGNKHNNNASGGSSATATATVQKEGDVGSSPPRTNNNKSHKFKFRHAHASNKSSSSSSSYTPTRNRFNSRDLPRSYSGVYGAYEDGMALELSRKEHTDWLEVSPRIFLSLYLAGLAAAEIVVVVALDLMRTTLQQEGVLDHEQNDDDSNNKGGVLYLGISWTIVHFIHMSVTLLFFHWFKGSLYDTQGELSSMTLWEQLEGRPHTSTLKRLLTVIPTLWTWMACHAAHYSLSLSIVNLVLWSVEVIAKMPAMNGVRIFGINTTVGVDDDYATNEDDSTTINNKKKES